MSDNKTTLPRLIFISDIRGKQENMSWMNEYTKPFESKYDIRVYCAQELAGIDKSISDKGLIHKQFIEGGIEKAVAKLIELESEQINIIAFSIGGTIAWKACLKSLNVENMILISSTRLRYETKPIKGNCTLLYGQLDAHKPDSDWLESMNLGYEIIDNAIHEMYREEKLAEKVCDNFLNT
ncbi:hypothetical protein [Aureibacter tunicatorum]|uniref:Alpha/beta hydrolase n=1 Tax=Aureibacter tunicatorum TaxID=866807 RepID=A0AAE3XMF8_9BACT|nr:hypothetical protein [Aureibacter tunicatorum]MDR6240606.1 hypothetical protein [Aureibacter tunicatorum]BDD06533.1 hypothetical protein AUTU_40160 [Aureibacter tunicatorum]